MVFQNQGVLDQHLVPISHCTWEKYPTRKIKHLTLLKQNNKTVPEMPEFKTRSQTGILQLSVVPYHESWDWWPGSGEDGHFIISLPTDVLCSLLLFQYVSCQGLKFTVRNHWSRSGPGQMGGKEVVKETRGGITWELTTFQKMNYSRCLKKSGVQMIFYL